MKHRRFFTAMSLGLTLALFLGLEAGRMPAIQAAPSTLPLALAANNAPVVGTTRVLYNGLLGTLPDAQGKFSYAELDINPFPDTVEVTRSVEADGSSLYTNY